MNELFIDFAPGRKVCAIKDYGINLKKKLKTCILNTSIQYIMNTIQYYVV